MWPLWKFLWEGRPPSMAFFTLWGGPCLQFYLYYNNYYYFVCFVGSLAVNVELPHQFIVTM